jgi:hypothetical protein
MDFPLEEFFAAIAVHHEVMVEEGIMPEGDNLNKHQFMHLVIDALEMMCECGQCDDEDNAASDKVINWQIAMVSLFGNLEDVDVTITGDGTTNNYEATHVQSGRSASVQCPRSEINTAEDQETHMIRAMEKLHAELQP